MRIAGVIALVPVVTPPELEDWIDRGFVLPAGEKPDWAFAEIDVARVRLLSELRHDLGVEVETLGLVLSLLDRLHDLRHAMDALLDAAATLPPAQRAALLAALRRRLG